MNNPETIKTVLFSVVHKKLAGLNNARRYRLEKLIEEEMPENSNNTERPY